MSDYLTPADMLLAIKHAVPRLVESPWVPPNEIVLVNDLGLPLRRPEGWASMDLDDKLRWAVENGLTIVIRGAA